MAISPQQLTIYLYSAHRAVIFAIAQLSCKYWNITGLAEPTCGTRGVSNTTQYATGTILARYNL